MEKDAFYLHTVLKELMDVDSWIGGQGSIREWKNIKPSKIEEELTKCMWETVVSLSCIDLRRYLMYKETKKNSDSVSGNFTLKTYRTTHC